MTMKNLLFQRQGATVLITLLATLSHPAYSQTSPHNLTASAEAPETADAPRPAPRYLLQNSDGRAVMPADFKDRFQLIAFGYISCPDVCPTTMLEMQQVLQALGPRAKHLQPIFISVDPQRDTLAVLGAYAANFDMRIMGLTGSETLLRFAANNFNVTYTKIHEPGAGPNVYTVDHTAGMFLLGPDGQLLKKFGYSTPVANITQEIEQWMSADKK
jgi:cytochrome oxidase Cu insertion factor (SCO1/SenC/PrrC family)